MAKSILDKKSVETRITGGWGYPKRRRRRRGRQEVGDDAVMEFGKKTVLKLEPGRRRWHGDVPTSRQLVGGSSANRSRRLRKGAAKTRGRGGGEEGGGGVGGGGEVGGGGGGTPAASPSPARALLLSLISSPLKP